jgi:hypothetical protein
VFGKRNKLRVRECKPLRSLHGGLIYPVVTDDLRRRTGLMTADVFEPPHRLPQINKRLNEIQILQRLS